MKIFYQNTAQIYPWLRISSKDAVNKTKGKIGAKKKEKIGQESRIISVQFAIMNSARKTERPKNTSILYALEVGSAETTLL